MRRGSVRLVRHLHRRSRDRSRSVAAWSTCPRPCPMRSNLAAHPALCDAAAGRPARAPATPAGSRSDDARGRRAHWRSLEMHAYVPGRVRAPALGRHSRLGRAERRGFARWMKHLTPSVLTALQWGWGHPFRVGLARAHSVALGDGVAGMLRALLLAIRHLARGASRTLTGAGRTQAASAGARARGCSGRRRRGMLRALLLRTRHSGSSALTLVQARRPRDDRSPRLSRAHPGPHHHECPECSRRGSTTSRVRRRFAWPSRLPGVSCARGPIDLTERWIQRRPSDVHVESPHPVRLGRPTRLIAAGLIALASGALLVLIASVFSIRTTVIPGLMLNMAARAPSDGGTRVVPAARPAAPPDDHREASRIMVGSARPSGRVPRRVKSEPG